jgi:hypothetical protein
VRRYGSVLAGRIGHLGLACDSAYVDEVPHHRSAETEGLRLVLVVMNYHFHALREFIDADRNAKGLDRELG